MLYVLFFSFNRSGICPEYGSFRIVTLNRFCMWDQSCCESSCWAWWCITVFFCYTGNGGLSYSLICSCYVFLSAGQPTTTKWRRQWLWSLALSTPICSCSKRSWRSSIVTWRCTRQTGEQHMYFVFPKFQVTLVVSWEVGLLKTSTC